jgi:hypothetical protein
MFDEKRITSGSEPLNAELSNVEAWEKSRASTAIESQPKKTFFPKRKEGDFIMNTSTD